MDDVDSRLRRLLDRGQTGDALALLHELYAPDVSRFLRHLDAGARLDDLAQEVWLAARRALPRFRFEAAPRTWLFAIARRRLADAQRRDGGREVPFSSRAEVLHRLLPVALGPRPPSTPSSRLRRKRRAAALEAELGRLPPGERELLELRFLEGIRPVALVEILDLPDSPNTVSQRIVRLVRRLRSRLLLHPEFRES